MKGLEFIYKKEEVIAISEPFKGRVAIMHLKTGEIESVPLECLTNNQPNFVVRQKLLGDCSSEITIEQAMETLKSAMKRDPKYAYSWYTTIAQICMKTLRTPPCSKVREISEETATKFIERVFGVRISGENTRNKERQCPKCFTKLKERTDNSSYYSHYCVRCGELFIFDETLPTSE